MVEEEDKTVSAKHCPRMDNGSEEMFFPSFFFSAKTICGKGLRNRSI